jgi:outer membrane lipoprotein-sorting protein
MQSPRIGPAQPDLRLSTPTDKIGFQPQPLEEMRYNPNMPNKQSALLAAALLVLFSASWAQDPAPKADQPAAGAPSTRPAETPPTPAERVIDEAITKLKALDTYAADINMEADMLGQVFKVVGQYVRKPKNMLLMRLTIEGLGDSSGLMQRSCDGQTYWIYLRVLESPQLRSFQLNPILNVLQKPEAQGEFRDSAMTRLGFSGTESLLEGLRKAGRFDQLTEETLNDRPVWVIRGLWTDRAAAAVPAAQNAMDRSGFLPRYIPSHLTLYIDRETGWPHKIVMQGKLPQQIREQTQLDPFGRPIGRKSSRTKERPSSLTLTYTRVERQVGDDEFQFQPPPNVNSSDDTEQQLARLEAELLDYTTRKRNEETKKSGEVLDQPINAPAPNPGEAPAPQKQPEEKGKGQGE